MPENVAGGPAVGAGAPGKQVPGVAANCMPWAEVLQGPHRYVNDQWGSDKARGMFEQCLLTRGTGDEQRVGWTWSWPGIDASVFAYPSATFGWKPWAGGESTDVRLPVKVADVQHMTLRYAVETEAQGSYNLAPEVWLTSSSSAPAQADPSLITREIMFWMEYEGAAVPAGSPIDSITLDGQPYELWKEDNIGKDANGTGWMLLTIKSSKVQRQASIPLHDVFNALVQRKLLSSGEYVASIEFGNEVMGGSGTTWVEQLEVELR